MVGYENGSGSEVPLLGPSLLMMMPPPRLLLLAYPTCKYWSLVSPSIFQKIRRLTSPQLIGMLRSQCQCVGVSGTFVLSKLKPVTLLYVMPLGTSTTIAALCFSWVTTWASLQEVKKAEFVIMIHLCSFVLR